MNLKLKYFDQIRIGPASVRKKPVAKKICAWPDCSRPAPHRAPRQSGNSGEYLFFCLDHVRRYNKSYNYFTGMGDEQVRDWLEREHFGHRPTWRLGQTSWAAQPGGDRPLSGPAKFILMRGRHGAGRFHEKENHLRRPPATEAQIKALAEIGLDQTATAQEVKEQYKGLVKRLHPDANGGSRANEEKLRLVIHAYESLRSSGYGR